MSVLEDISKLKRIVGNTPMKCSWIGSVRVCIKLEYSNPTGSHKDRIALSMIERAVRERLLDRGGCVAEASSGNTAVSVAWASGFLGVRSVLYVEKESSPLKKAMIKLMGGQLVEIGDEGLDIYRVVEESEEMGCIFLDQLRNPANPGAHYYGTAHEILVQAGHRIDALVMGVGTGGTIMGVGTRLKEELGNTLVIGVTPRGSPLDPRGLESPPSRIEGLASRTVPPLTGWRSNVIDRIEPACEEDARSGIRGLAKEIGILAGLSTGAAYHAFKKLLKEGVFSVGDTVVLIAADHITRYPNILTRL